MDERHREEIRKGMETVVMCYVNGRWMGVILFVGSREGVSMGVWGGRVSRIVSFKEGGV